MDEYRFDFGTIRNHWGYRLNVDPRGRCRVEDGDTIIVGGQPWRLHGIDAPPVKGHSSRAPVCEHEAELGRMARDRLIALVVAAASRRALRIDALRTKDKFGRQMVRIYDGAISLGDVLVAEGLALPYDGRRPKQRFCSCR